MGCSVPHSPEISCGSWLLAVLQKGWRLCSVHSEGKQRDAVLTADSRAGSAEFVPHLMLDFRNAICIRFSEN